MNNFLTLNCRKNRKRTGYLMLWLLLPILANAQSGVIGLGRYHIGHTTIDSLSKADFREEPESYVKGTIALPCSHIRIVKALQTDVAGVQVSNLSLYFYDDTLFRISCDYTAGLQQAFMVTHGKGTVGSKQTVQFCAGHTDKPTEVWGETWTHGDIQAMAVYAKGYTTDCVLVENSVLDIISRSMSALASDCELRNTHLFVDQYSTFLQAHEDRLHRSKN